MRKGLIYPLLSMAVAASLLAGCTGGQQSKDYMEENDSVTVYPPDTAFYGHLGEGTGMSSLELITDDGDTLALKKNRGTGTYIGRNSELHRPICHYDVRRQPKCKRGPEHQPTRTKEMAIGH